MEFFKTSPTFYHLKTNEEYTVENDIWTVEELIYKLGKKSKFNFKNFARFKKKKLEKSFHNFIRYIRLERPSIFFDNWHLKDHDRSAKNISQELNNILGLRPSASSGQSQGASPKKWRLYSRKFNRFK